MQENKIYYEALQGAFSVRHKITTTPEKASFHIHDEFELLLVLSDGISCETGNAVYHLEKNTLLIFNNMDLHHLFHQPGTVNDRYVAYFKPDYIRNLSSSQTDLQECFIFRPFPNPHILPLTQQQADSLVQIFDKIIRIESLPDGQLYGKDLNLSLLHTELLLQANRLYRNRHHLVNGAVFGSYSPIYNIITYIHQNYWDNLSLDELSQRFYINKFHLCTLFKKVTGMSPNQYLINCRLMKAKELLLNQMPVEEVCSRIGYNNLSHFSRSFKQWMGISPKKFQLSAQKNGSQSINNQ